MGEQNSSNETSRRNFLKSGIVAGAAAVTGVNLLSSFAPVEDKGQKVKVLTPEGNIVEVDDAKMVPVKEIQQELGLTELQKRGREGIAGKHWVMVIDLAKCRNARKCMESCQNAHHLKPAQHHINVLQMQDGEHTAPYYMPKPCMHCDNTPCTKVCPVDATFKRQDGIILIDNERCIGCRFCVAACPYSARVFNWTETLDEKNAYEVPYNIELNVPQKKGTISKCLFSADRLREGLLPYCVSACPNGTYWFGDLNEDAVTNGTTGETVRFSQLIEENDAYTLLPELGTKPNVYYLPAKDRQFPFSEEDKKKLEESRHQH
ncbi:MAG: 4Fe-4S dicluster domain-containing protein [Bacteroidales bacterium]|nr:4Fe-4S dicluster domain-containing protein [Bacteroidales bacterium]